MAGEIKNFKDYVSQGIESQGLEWKKDTLAKKATESFRTKSGQEISEAQGRQVLDQFTPEEIENYFKNRDTFGRGLDANASLCRLFTGVVGEEVVSIDDGNKFSREVIGVGGGKKAEEITAGSQSGPEAQGKLGTAAAQQDINYEQGVIAQNEQSLKKGEAKTEEAKKGAGVKGAGGDKAETYKPLSREQQGEKGIVKGDAYSSTIRGAIDTQKSARDMMGNTSANVTKTIAEKAGQASASKTPEGMEIEGRQADGVAGLNVKKTMTSNITANKGATKGGQAKQAAGASKTQNKTQSLVNSGLSNKTHSAIGDILGAGGKGEGVGKAFSYVSGEDGALNELYAHRDNLKGEATDQISGFRDKVGGIGEGVAKDKQDISAVKTETLTQDQTRLQQAGQNIGQVQKEVKAQGDFNKNLQQLVQIDNKMKQAASEHEKLAYEDLSQKNNEHQGAMGTLSAALGTLSAALALPDMLPVTPPVPNPAKPPAVASAKQFVATAEALLKLAEIALKKSQENAAQKRKENQDAAYNAQMNQLTQQAAQVAQQNQQILLQQALEVRNTIMQQVQQTNQYLGTREEGVKTKEEEAKSVENKEAQASTALADDLARVSEHIEYQEKIRESKKAEGTKKAEPADEKGQAGAPKKSEEKGEKVEDIPEEFQAGKRVDLKFESGYDPDTKTFKDEEKKGSGDAAGGAGGKKKTGASASNVQAQAAPQAGQQQSAAAGSGQDTTSK